MRRLFFFILAMLLINHLFAQEYEEITYAMSPTCGKEKVIRKLNFKGDTVYLFHLKPNACPRCEAAIFSITELLQKRNIFPYIIFDVPNKTVVKEYLKNNNLSRFKGRVIVDTNGVFRQFIDYNKTNLNIPYFYKIVKSIGKFNVIRPLLSDITDSLIDGWVNTKSIISCNESAKIFDSNPTSVIPYPDSASWDIISKLTIANESITTPTDIYLTNKYVGLVDMQTNKVHVFDLETNSQSTYKVDTSEYYLFSGGKSHDISQWITFGRKTSLLKVIYLGIADIRKNEIDIVASIPNISIDYTGDTTIEYRNKAVILKKEHDNPNIQFTSITIPSSDTFSYKHSMFRRISNNNYSIGVVKGWPATGTKFTDKMKGDPTEDPFIDDFYLDIPVCALYNNEGEHLGDFGRLPQKAQELKLGYYYGGHFALLDSQNLLIVDQIWGEVQFISKVDIEQRKNFIYKRVQLMPEKQNYKRTSTEKFNDNISYFNDYRYIMDSYIVNFNDLDSNYWYYIKYDKNEGTLALDILSKHDYTIKNVYKTTVSKQKFKTVKLLPISEKVSVLVAISTFNEGVYFMKKKIILDNI